jgi:7-cyano-7-deazaguanine synthase in queuosine biosynthesis
MSNIRRVIVGVSGGVDSAVAALFLKRKGNMYSIVFVIAYINLCFILLFTYEWHMYTDVALAAVRISFIASTSYKLTNV